MAQSKISALEGKELADYARTHLPEGRWADAWDLLKKNFFKFVTINVFTLLFFLPALALILYFRPLYLNYLGVLYPFSANVGLSTYIPASSGLAENIYLTVDLEFFAALIGAGLIASVGIAGAAYSVRQLINTHGEFKARDYFHGVKVCYLNTALTVTVFLIFLFGSVAVSDWAALAIAQGSGAGGPITAQVFMIIATVLVGIYCSWTLAVGVSYKVKLKTVLKSSLTLMISTIIQTVFMLGFALLPVWLAFIPVQFILIIVYAIFLFIGFSFILLCWMAFAQWVFDAFLEPEIKTEKKPARENMTPKQLAMEKEEEEKAAALELLAAGKSELIGTPIKPIGNNISIAEINGAFTRGDISRVRSDRDNLDKEVKAYYDEHIHEKKYAEYNAMFADREKVLQVKDKKGKKSKKNAISSDNLLK